MARHPFIEKICEHFEKVPFNETERSVFYSVRKCFGQAVLEQGLPKTVEDAAAFFELSIPTDFWPTVLSEHQATFEALNILARQEPNTFLDEGIHALSSGQPGAALRITGRIHSEPVMHFAKYRAVLDHGPDRGLAYWQLINPFYYLWAALPAVTSAPSDRWYELQFNTGSQQNTRENLNFSNNDHLLANFLMGELSREFWLKARVLEAGCGNGRNALLLASKVGIDPINYFGFDLHQARVISTQKVISELAPEKLTEKDLDRIFQFDILSSELYSVIDKLDDIDVVFSSSFTNVFTDEQLPSVIRKLVAPKPNFIVDVSVTTSWSLCIGRYDPSEHYEKFGYKLRSQRLEVPLLGPREAFRLWMPDKYWSNRNILLFENCL